MKEINLIISQRQFVYNQIEGRRIRAERERQQEIKKEIERNKEKEQFKQDACKFIVFLCMVGLAIMFFGMIGV